MIGGVCQYINIPEDFIILLVMSWNPWVYHYDSIVIEFHDNSVIDITVIKLSSHSTVSDNSHISVE